MNQYLGRERLRRGTMGFCMAVLVVGSWCDAKAATDSRNERLVSRYGVFDQSFKGSVGYQDPLADMALSFEFVSPLGETNRIQGFWDGGWTWRVRFSPDEPGEWTYQATCSDRSNTNLQQIAGDFLCTPTVGKSRFDLHGPVRVAADGRHFEHEDRTPFFWLADTVWEGARQSKPEEWDYYAQVRSAQKFTAALWSASPGNDGRKRNAFSGGARMTVNLGFFKELDAKIEVLNRAGILNAIVPLWEIASFGTNKLESLPDGQAAAGLRYMVARWGAYNVVWVLACEGDSLGGKVERWKRIGRAVFGDISHAPVIVYPGATYWALDEFRGESWASVLGYQSGQEISDEAMQWLLAGPVASDWKKSPPRPVLSLAMPYENEAQAGWKGRAEAEAVRKWACWSLLNTPVMGVSYGGYGVWNWEINDKLTPEQRRSPPPPPWQKALFMPAARDMGALADFFGSIEFWRLRPAPEMVVNQPGMQSPSRHISAARTQSGDLAVVYDPSERAVELAASALPASSKAEWVNPRTGVRSVAVGVTEDTGWRFTTPDEGDWLLLIKAGQKMTASE